MTLTLGAIILTLATGYNSAAVSLQHNGMKYLDASDHGRLLQSAISYDGQGEANNPTEGGCSGLLASKLQRCSKLLSKSKTGAFYSVLGLWDSGMLSDTELLKTYTAEGDQGINIGAAFRVGSVHHSATVEALTAYLPVSNWPGQPSFPHVYSFNPLTRETLELDQNGEQRYPVIASSAKGYYAMGIYSPELPYQVGPDWVGYGGFKFPTDGVNKLNCVFRHGYTSAGTVLAHNCMVFVGTLSEVQTLITQHYIRDHLS